MTIIDDIMTTHLQTLDADSSVAEAAELMRQHDIGDVLVIDDDGCLCGIVTDRDIVLRVVAENRDPHTTRLSDVYTAEPLATLREGEPLDVAVDCLRMNGIRRLPVIDEDEHPVGIVTLGDLAMQRDPSSVLADISADPPNN